VGQDPPWIPGTYDIECVIAVLGKIEEGYHILAKRNTRINRRPQRLRLVQNRADGILHAVMSIFSSDHRERLAVG